MFGEGALSSIQLLYVGDDWRGSPAFQGELRKGEEVNPRLGKKVASLQFPDVRSCLSEEESNSWLIDWKKINNSRQAEICLFRILYSVKSMDDAVMRLRVQGFIVIDDSLFIERRGPITRRLDGYWSIRGHGPRFDSMRIFTYFLPELHHQMAVRTHWLEDEDQLAFVQVQYIMN